MGLNKRLIDQAGGAAGVTGTDNFDIKTWTGSGSSQTISGLDFQPDFVWIKRRTGAESNHKLTDSVRGEDKAISTSLTDAESTGSNYAVTSFNLDGFTLRNNNKTNDMVGWCWKAGGAAVSNTDGTITSSVSANQDAGFSIVSYTGNDSIATIGHGLNSAPELIIVKNRSITKNWYAYAAPLTADFYLQPNTNDPAENAVNNIWNDTEPTSTVFTVGDNNGVNDINNYIAYCFHSVDGYQKVGGYTGASGLSLNLGFQPRFFITKNADAAEAFAIYYYDGSQINLFFASSSSSENTNRTEISFTSTGIDFNTTGGHFNQTGYDFIYLAIA